MATVTGLTAARMLAIEAETISSGVFDSAGHLILTKHNGTQIDLGSVPGLVLDAASFTNATPPGSYPIGESFLSFSTTQGTTAGWGFGTAKAGTIRTYIRPANAGATQLFIRTHAATTTPEMWFRGGDSTGWSAWKKVATTDDTVQIIATNLLETDPPTAYPVGVSMLSLSSTFVWPSFPSGFGTVITNKITTDRTQQTIYNLGGGATEVQSWVRTYHSTNGGGGWSAWKQVVLMNNLVASSFSQTTAITSYPPGVSRLYYRDTDSSAWDFTGNFGEVMTYRDAAGNGFGRQTWVKHSAGSTGKPDMWLRTANNSTGWTPWRVASFDSDTGWVNMTYSSGFTGGTPTQLQYRVKNGIVYFRGGASGTFPAGQYTNVVDPGGIPAAYRPLLNTRGGAAGGTALPAIFEINTDGSIKLGHNGLTGSAPAWIAFTTSYPIA